MKINFLSVLLFLGALFFAKFEDVSKSDVAITENATIFKIDTKESIITWVGTKVTGKHNGTFAVSEGKVSVKNKKVVAGSFTIDIASLKVLNMPDDVETHKLKGHLLSKDFFSVEEFPTAKFTIIEIKPYQAMNNPIDEEKDPEYTLANPTHSITGNFELKGITKRITFPAKITIDKAKVEAEAKFNINRTDWGMTYGTNKSLGNKLIKPTVHIGFKVIGNK